MVEIEKCPFCGSDDIVVHVFGWENTVRCGVSIECKQCGGGMAKDEYKSKDDIIKQWNKRV